jgi:hypothetical protein
MERETSNTQHSQRMIGEAIRKIALGRSIERIGMSPGGTSGVGTARMIHGYVAKIHDNPSDDEYEAYAGTVDVGEFPDETASSEPIIHKGVLLSGVKDNTGGFLIVPTLFSDVTILSDAATKQTYVVNFSHAAILGLSAHTAATIGVTETEALDAEDTHAPDYDELEKTGNETQTRYTATRIETTARNKEGGEAVIDMTAEKMESRVGGTALTIRDGKVAIGEETATEPLVLGNQLAQLMLEFLTECTRLMTPTLMGAMPVVNASRFASLIEKIDHFLSQTAFTK